LRLEKDSPLVKDERYIGLNPKSTYVFFAKKSSTTGSYYAVGDPFFFEIKNNIVKLLTNEESPTSQRDSEAVQTHRYGMLQYRLHGLE
jgi:hypothetical protein